MHSFSFWLNEAKKEKDPVPKDIKGGAHEVLTAGYIRGYARTGKHGKYVHCSRHADDRGRTPEDYHNLARSKMSLNQWESAHERAKHAARAIIDGIEERGHKVEDCHWTPTGTHHTTGIPSSQHGKNADSSDIVVIASHEGKTKFHGRSLKVTDGTNPHVPLSNAGPAATFGHDKEELAKHRERLKKIIPSVMSLSNKNKRKAALAATNPSKLEMVENSRKQALETAAKKIHATLSKMTRSQRVHYLRTQILHAHEKGTPVQQAVPGSTFERTVTHRSPHSKSGLETRSYDPSTEYDHILNSPHPIEVEHAGNSVNFKHKGTIFASIRMKSESASDPLSSFKTSGNDAPGAKSSK